MSNTIDMETLSTDRVIPTEGKEGAEGFKYFLQFRTRSSIQQPLSLAEAAKGMSTTEQEGLLDNSSQDLIILFTCGTNFVSLIILLILCLLTAKQSRKISKKIHTRSYGIHPRSRSNTNCTDTCDDTSNGVRRRSGPILRRIRGNRRTRYRDTHVYAMVNSVLLNRSVSNTYVPADMPQGLIAFDRSEDEDPEINVEAEFNPEAADYIQNETSASMEREMSHYDVPRPSTPLEPQNTRLDYENLGVLSDSLIQDKYLQGKQHPDPEAVEATCIMMNDNDDTDFPDIVLIENGTDHVDDVNTNTYINIDSLPVRDAQKAEPSSSASNHPEQRASNHPEQRANNHPEQRASHHPEWRVTGQESCDSSKSRTQEEDNSLPMEDFRLSSDVSVRPKKMRAQNEQEPHRQEVIQRSSKTRSKPHRPVSLHSGRTGRNLHPEYVQRRAKTIYIPISIGDDDSDDDDNDDLTYRTNRRSSVGVKQPRQSADGTHQRYHSSQRLGEMIPCDGSHKKDNIGQYSPRDEDTSNDIETKNSEDSNTCRAYEVDHKQKQTHHRFRQFCSQAKDVLSRRNSRTKSQVEAESDKNQTVNLMNPGGPMQVQREFRTASVQTEDVEQMPSPCLPPKKRSTGYVCMTIRRLETSQTGGNLQNVCFFPGQSEPKRCLSHPPATLADLPSSSANCPASPADSPVYPADFPIYSVDSPVYPADCPSSPADFTVYPADSPGSPADPPTSSAHHPASQTDCPASPTDCPAAPADCPAAPAD